MRIARLLALLVTLLSLAACSANRGGLVADRPADAPFRVELPTEPSSISVTFETGAADLAAILNRTIATEIYRGPLKGSGASATILRNGPIGVTMADDAINLSLPVTVSLAYGLVSTPTMATRLQFRIRPAITSDWKITADVQYTGFDDMLANEISIGPLTIKPRGAVDGALQSLRSALSTQVSREINSRFSLRSHLEQGWRAAQQPILLSREHKAWLKLTPKSVMLTPLRADRNRARISMGLVTLAELTVGPEPVRGAPAPLPVLQQVSSLDRSFRLSLRTELRYRDIVDLLKPLLIGKEFDSDGNSIVIREFDLYGNGELVVVRLVTTGSLDGTIYLTGTPRFKPETNRFSVENLDFDINTESALMRSADWFLHGSIRERIQEKLNLDLTQRITDARDMAQKGLINLELAEHVHLKGNIADLRFKEVLVQNDRISLQLYAEGETVMELK